MFLGQHLRPEKVDTPDLLRTSNRPPDLRSNLAARRWPDVRRVSFKKFIREFLPLYVDYRKSLMRFNYGEQSSVKAFVTRKIEILVELDQIERKSAVERVFFELPAKLAGKFFETNSELTESTLLDFADFADNLLTATYNEIRPRTDDLSLDHDNDEADQSAMSVSNESSSADSDEYNEFYDYERLRAARRSRKGNASASGAGGQGDTTSRQADVAGPSNVTAAVPARRGRGRPRKAAGSTAGAAAIKEPTTKKRKRS